MTAAMAQKQTSLPFSPSTRDRKNSANILTARKVNAVMPGPAQETLQGAALLKTLNSVLDWERSHVTTECRRSHPLLRRQMRVT